MYLPADVYYRVVNIAESYYILLDRLKEMESSVMFKGPIKDGQPRGNQLSNPTARKAEKIMRKQEECNRKITAIELSLKHVGPVYREFIKQHFFEHKPMESIDLHMSLQDKEDVKQFFLIKLARNLNEI
jgi:hypothetical protein